MGSTKVAPSKSELLNDLEFKKAIKGALQDIDTYANQLQGIDGLSGDEAKMKIAQLFYKNMKWADEPVQAAKYLLAKTMTFQELQEIINPEGAIRDIDTQIKLLDQSRKTIKLVNDMKPKEVNVNMQGKDDAMPIQFIDIDE